MALAFLCQRFAVMKILKTCVTLAALLVATVLHAEPVPGAQAIIDELGLREASAPISAQPGYQPKKVLMVLPNFDIGVDVKAISQQVAGDVALEYVDWPGYRFDPERLAGVDAVIGWCLPHILEAAEPSLLWVHNYGVGMDRCTSANRALFANRVFTNNKGLSGPGIAEHAIAMMFALSRNFPAVIDTQRQKQWDPALMMNMTFGELPGKTMLVVGLGGIGKQVAWRANALGMRVIATRNSSREGPDYVDYVGLADELNALAAEADVVVNTLPLTPKTEGVFDKAFFDAMPERSIFISVGRGKSTVEADLVAALESGKLFGAGLDVTDPEPLPASSPLWTLKNVLITPHIAGGGAENIYRSMTIALENLRRYVAGEPLLNTVDMERGY